MRTTKEASRIVGRVQAVASIACGKHNVPQMRFASLLVVLALAGCSDPPHDPVENDPCAGHIQLMGVTDEACRAYVEAESRSLVVTDAAKAPAWVAPDAATTSLPAAPPARFAWTKGTLARSPWKKLLRMIDPLPEAWAHGDTTGDAYVLIFKDGTGAERHRVMTVNTEYTPGPAAWDPIRAGGTFSVTLIGVRFTQNVIASGTKPTAADPRTFAVQ
jgi:hypothetical protein